MPKFRLTQSQIASIKKAAKENRSLTLTLSSSDLDPNGIEIGVDTRLLQDGKRHRIRVNPPRITKEGGILPLIPIIGAIAAALGGAAATSAGVAATVKSAREANLAKQMAQTDLVRRELAQLKLAEKKAGSGFYLKNKGSGYNLRSGRSITPRKRKGGIFPLIPLALGALSTLGGTAVATAAARRRMGMGLKKRRL